MCDILLALHRARAVKPDLLVIGASWRDFPHDGVIAQKETATYELLCDAGDEVPDFMRLQGVEERAEYALKRVWSLFRFRNWIRMNMGALVNALTEPEREKNPQFFQDRGEVDRRQISKLVQARYSAYEIKYPNQQTACLDKALSLVELDQTRLAVINMPVSSLWFELDPSGQQRDAANLLRAVGGRAGFHRDASRLYGNGFFIDSRHLGRKGALAFSRWLAGEVAVEFKIDPKPAQ